MVALNDKVVHNSLSRYFKMLTNTGFASIRNTRRIIVEMFLNEWLNSDMSFFLTDKDYNKIASAYRVISGDCLIPYANYCNRKLRVGISGTRVGSPMLMGTSVYERVRHTESDSVRFAESNPVRLVEGATTLGE